MVVIFFTATTIPRWWSGKSKCESFILLSLIALQRHWCDILTMLERLHAHPLFYQQHVRRFFQIRAGITPQDVLTSIVALAIILCLKLTLFVATPLSKLQQYPWTTFRLCKYTCRQHFHLLKHKLLRANQKFLCSFALEKFCFASYLNCWRVAIVPFSKM